MSKERIAAFTSGTSRYNSTYRSGTSIAAGKNIWHAENMAICRAVLLRFKATASMARPSPM